MPVTPDVIISKPLKFIRNTLLVIGLFFAVLAVVAFNNSDGRFLVHAILSAGVFFLATKIKFKLIKRVQVDGYERV